MLSLVFLYVFNFGLLLSMSCVNYIIEKKKKMKMDLQRSNRDLGLGKVNKNTCMLSSKMEKPHKK